MSKKKIDPIKANVPNVNFTLIDKGDPRWDEFKKQRLKRGFDDSETWSLDSTFYNFFIPRLERYVEITDGMFSDKEYEKKVRLFLEALKMKKDSIFNCEILTSKQERKINKGLSLFPEILGGLWW